MLHKLCTILLLGAINAPTQQPLITSITVEWFTQDDDKDREEAVNTYILGPNGQQIGHDRRGAGEVYPDDKLVPAFTIPLNPQVFSNYANQLKLKLYKEPHGSATGAEWHLTMKVTGNLSNGTQLTLLNTGRFEIGDDNPHTLIFQLGH